MVANKQHKQKVFGRQREGLDWYKIRRGGSPLCITCVE